MKKLNQKIDVDYKAKDICLILFTAFIMLSAAFNAAAQNCSVEIGVEDTAVCGHYIPIPHVTGTAPFTYQWSPATGLNNTNVASPMIQDVYNQTYTLIVVDANNCTSVDQVTVTASINTLYHFPDIDTLYLCDNGTVTIDLGPGSQSYSWQNWVDLNGVSHPLNATTQSIVATQPGRYIGYEIGNVCSSSPLMNIFNVRPCSEDNICNHAWNYFEQQHNPVGCYTDSVILAGTGGGQIVSWNWYSPDYGNFGNQPTVNLNMAANFEHSPNPPYIPVTLTTVDNNGCTSVRTLGVYPHTNSVYVNLYGDTAMCTGSYTLTPGVYSGTGPFTYQWEPEAYFTNPNLLTQTFTDVYNEAFYLYVTDANGCTTSDTLYITVTDSPDNFDTIYSCNSQVQLSLPNPIVYYGTSYLWSNGATTQNIVFNGTGEVWGRASVPGCSYLYMFYTIYPCNLSCSVDIGPDTTVCQSSFIPEPLTTGTGPFTYQWSPSTGLSNSYIANPVIEDVYNQQYTLTVTDANNCTAIDSILVTSYTASSDSLFLCNGSVTLDLGPGSTYQWINWQDTLGNFHQMNQVTQTITIAEPGTYLALEYTLGGCGVLTSQFFVGVCEPGCNNAWNTFTYAHSQLCNADNIQLAGTGNSEIVSWEWYLNQNPNPFETTQNATLYLTDSSPVYVTLHTTDEFGCLDTTTQYITPVLTQLSVDIGSDTTVCNNSYTVTPQVTGGSAPFTYTLSYNNHILTYNNWVGDPFSQTLSDIYQTPVSFTAVDANGCIAGDTIIVTAFDNQPNIDTVYLCNSTAYLLQPLGGQSYNWSNGSTTPGITVNTPGTYTGYGLYPPCGIILNTFHVLPCNTTCFNIFTYQHNPWACGDSVLFAGTAGTSVVNWTWDFGDGHIQSGTSPTVYHYYPPQPGVSYVVTLTTTDANGCTAVSTNTILIQGGNSINVFAGDDEVYCSPGTYSLDAYATGGTAPYSWNWFPSTGMSNTAIPNPSVIVQGPVTYTFTVIDANGCMNTDTISLDYRHPINDTLYLCGTEVTLCQHDDALVYDWMGGELSQCITVTDTGHYWGVETFTGCGVTQTPATCYSFDEQNLNVNQIQNAFYLYGDGTNGFLQDWKVTGGTPSVHPSGNISGVNAYDGNQYALLAVCDAPGDYSEGISLEHNFQQGHSYTVSMAVRNRAMISGTNVPIDLKFILLQNNIPFTYQFSTGCTSTPAIPGNSQTAYALNSFDDNFWQVITFNITNVSSNFSQLWFRAKRSPGAPQLTTFFMIDSLCINEINPPGSTEILTNSFYVAPCTTSCHNDFAYTYYQWGCGDSIYIYANTSAPCSSYLWDLGDGNIVSTTTPYIYHYYNAGQYDITLTTVDVDNCTSMMTQTLTFDLGFDVNIAGYYSSNTTQFTMGNGNNATTCTGSFYDSGGPSGNYQDNQNLIYTIYPATQGNVASLNFSSFISETGYDFITIYNNNTVGGTILYGPASGTLSLGTITANLTGNPTGALTIKFTSDATISFGGWEAAISCQSPNGQPQYPDTIIACQGSAQLNATPSVPGNYFYQWSPSAGLNNPYVANPVANMVQNMQYSVTVTDINTGCVATDSVLVSSYNWVADTFEICGDSVLLDFGPGATNYYWQGFTDVSGNHSNLNVSTQTLYANQAGQYFGYAYFPGCGALTSLFTVVECPGDSVWPGDANADGQAHNMDLLSIGIGYGTNGLLRPNATISWQPEASPDWGLQLLAGTDYKHIDCNGDAVIDVDDTLAVIQNYGLLHSLAGGDIQTSDDDPMIYLTAQTDTALTGASVTIPVGLGTLAVPANDVYGIGFTVHYNQDLVETNTMGISFTNSWFGNHGLNMISIRKNFHGFGLIDVALTRIDHQNVSGHGTIGELHFITIDNLSGKETLYETLQLYITNVRLIRHDEREVPLGIQNDSLVVTNFGNAVNELSSLEGAISIYPNPAKGVLNMVIPNELSLQNAIVKIMNATGQLISESLLLSRKSSFDVSALADGVYFIQVSTDKGNVSKRFVVIK